MRPAVDLQEALGEGKAGPGPQDLLLMVPLVCPVCLEPLTHEDLVL